MSVTLIIILLVLGVLIGLIVYTYFKMKNTAPVPDSEKIRTLGPKNFKPVIRSGVTLVDFWAPWCGPCKVAAPILNDVAESVDKITVAKVNVDKQQQLAQKYKIRSIPTLILFRDGVEVKRYTGVKTKRFLLKEIESVAG